MIQILLNFYSILVPTRKMLRRWRPREARHGYIYIYMSGYKVLLLARSNLIWVAKCMCVRCRLLKYVYGSSMRS